MFRVYVPGCDRIRCVQPIIIDGKMKWEVKKNEVEGYGKEPSL